MLLKARHDELYIDGDMSMPLNKAVAIEQYHSHFRWNTIVTIKDSTLYGIQTRMARLRGKQLTNEP